MGTIMHLITSYLESNKTTTLVWTMKTMLWIVLISVFIHLGKGFFSFLTVKFSTSNGSQSRRVCLEAQKSTFWLAQCSEITTYVHTLSFFVLILSLEPLFEDVKMAVHFFSLWIWLSSRIHRPTGSLHVHSGSPWRRFFLSFLFLWGKRHFVRFHAGWRTVQYLITVSQFKSDRTAAIATKRCSLA